MAFQQGDASAAGQPTLTSQAHPAGDVLLMGAAAATAQLAPVLRGNYRVVVSSSFANARAFLARLGVDVMVTDMDVPDVASIDLCREAKALRKPPAVLVTTEHVERVPDALEARCDGVLLKPFPPNLLVARIGRLIRGRGQHAQSGTNRFWPDSGCPYCECHCVTSFEFASHRRSWYACGKCKKVWLGKRQE
jgi:DNA-binding NarL/FixJ family response regulator